MFLLTRHALIRVIYNEEFLHSLKFIFLLHCSCINPHKMPIINSKRVTEISYLLLKGEKLRLGVGGGFSTQSDHGNLFLDLHIRNLYLDNE